MNIPLTVDTLKKEAKQFAICESQHEEPSLYGVTDGKAVGTYLEQKFQKTLKKNYDYVCGSAAKGIDFPDLNIDIKTTSIRQPQSSCPFKSVRQKIYGLGYSLLVFVYDKKDISQNQTTRLDIKHVIFIDALQTADYQTTSGILQILNNQGNIDDLIAFMADRFLPVDEIQAAELAEELFTKRPDIGYLTISNALQWRLQYSRVIEKAGSVLGVERIV